MCLAPASPGSVPEFSTTEWWLCPNVTRHWCLSQRRNWRHMMYKRKETWHPRTDTQGLALYDLEPISTPPRPQAPQVSNGNLALTHLGGKKLPIFLDYFSPTSPRFMRRKRENLKIRYASLLTEIFLTAFTWLFSWWQLALLLKPKHCLKTGFEFIQKSL